MYYVYKLSILSELVESRKISEVIGIHGHDSDEGLPGWWEIRNRKEEDDNYFDFINHYLDILENKYEELEKIGVVRSDISVWMYYAYDEQCNMEFSPGSLKRLGDNGVTLCISCWQT